MADPRLRCWICGDADLRIIARKNAECPACKHFFTVEEIGAYETGVELARRELVEEVAAWLASDEVWDLPSDVGAAGPSPAVIAEAFRAKFGAPEGEP